MARVNELDIIREQMHPTTYPTTPASFAYQLPLISYLTTYPANYPTTPASFARA